MSIREIKNYPVNSGTGMSIREAFDVVNANFNYLSIEAIPEQVADSIADLSANLSTTFTGGNISSATRILSNTDSISSVTGAFVVDGGAGIAGNVNIGEMLTANSVSITGNLSAANASITGSISTANLAVSGLTSVSSMIMAGGLEISAGPGPGADSLFTGNITFGSASGINISSRIRGNTVVAYGAVNSTDPVTGALLVPNGGAGIVGNVNVGQNLNVSGNVIVNNSYVPTGSTSTGTAGHLTWDQAWFYICVGTNQWIRFAKDTGAW